VSIYDVASFRATFGSDWGDAAPAPAASDGAEGALDHLKYRFEHHVHGSAERLCAPALRVRPVRVLLSTLDYIPPRIVQYPPTLSCIGENVPHDFQAIFASSDVFTAADLENRLIRCGGGPRWFVELVHT